MRSYFASLGPGEHLLGMDGGQLVSHLMWVTRWLEPQGDRPLKTAYVEMAALCPATDGLYVRLSWRYWRGPLFARRDGQVVPTPEERVMIMPLPLTPTLDCDAPLSVEWRHGEVW